MLVYQIEGKTVGLHEGRLFVEVTPTESSALVLGERGVPEKQTGKIGGTKGGRGSAKKEPAEAKGKRVYSKRSKLSDAVRELLEGEILAGVKSMAELGAEYEVSSGYIYTLKNRLGSKKQAGKNKEAKAEKHGILKNFQCGCGKGFSARTSGEAVKCPDPECGEMTEAGEGVDV